MNRYLVLLVSICFMLIMITSAFKNHLYSQEFSGNFYLNREIPDDFERWVFLAQFDDFDYSFVSSHFEPQYKSGELQDNRLTLHGKEFTNNSLKKWKNRDDVYELDLSNSNVTDEGMEIVQSLTNLRWLDISNTKITDVGLKKLSKFDKLTYLRVKNTPVNGTSLEGAAYVPVLESLNLSYTQISDHTFKYLNQAKNLQALYLEETSVSERGLSLIENFSKLQILFMPKGIYGDDTARILSKFPDLIGETLINIQFSLTDEGLKSLSKIKEMTKLELVNSNISEEGYQLLKNFKDIYFLSLSGSNFTDAAVIQIDQLPALRILNLSGTQVTDQGIKTLLKYNKISELDVSNTQVTDDIFPFLRPKEHLTALNLSQTKITGEGFKHLMSQQKVGTGYEPSVTLPSLKKIDLSNSKFNAENLDYVKRFPELEWLSLKGIPITRKSEQEHLYQMFRLNFLDLSDTEIDDMCLKYLRCNHDLEELKLCGTNISGEGLTHLTNFYLLKELDLSRSAVTNEGLRSLQDVINVKKLNLSHTGITTTGLQSLCGQGYEYLDLSFTNITDEDVQYLNLLSSYQYLARFAPEWLEKQTDESKEFFNAPFALNLTGTKITNKGLEGVGKINLLGMKLGGTHINEKSLKPLASIKNLKVLDISETNIPIQAIENFKRTSSSKEIVIYR